MHEHALLSGWGEGGAAPVTTPEYMPPIFGVSLGSV